MPFWFHMDLPAFHSCSSVRHVLFVGKTVDKTPWLRAKRELNTPSRQVGLWIPSLTEARGFTREDEDALRAFSYARVGPRDIGWQEPTGVRRFVGEKSQSYFDTFDLFFGSPKFESKHWVIAADECIVDSLENVNALRRFLKPGARLWVLERALLTLPYLEGLEGLDDTFSHFMASLGYRALRFKGSVREARLSLGEKAPSGLRPAVTNSPLMKTPALVIGAGLAGALVAYRLAQQGIRASVIDRYSVPGAGASALYAGLIHPHWQRSDSPLFALTRRGYESTLSLLERFPSCFEATGVMDCATSEAEYQEWLDATRAGEPYVFPEAYLALQSREEAQRRSGLALAHGGWYFPKAGLVHCGAWVKALLAASEARVLTAMAVKVVPGESARWMAVTDAGVPLCEADQVFICAGMASASIVGARPEQLGLSPLKGRISLLPEGSLSAKMPVTGQGYVMKTEGFEAVGATYESERETWTAERAHAHNLEAFKVLFDEGASERDLAEAPWCGFYEGTRAVPEDRLPLMGPFFLGATLRAQTFKGSPELKAIARDAGLWICAGLGSRGLTWGALLAEEVVAMALARPGTLPGNLRQALDPARFAYDAKGVLRA